MAVLGAVAAHGKMAHGAVACVEMAVPHEVVRRIDRADLELVALALLAVFPEHHVAFALSDDDHRPRTVAVKGAAATRRKLPNMTTVGRVREREAHVSHAFALHGKIVERELIHVGNQIGFPIPVGDVFVEAQEIVALMKPGAKVEWIWADELPSVKNRAL